MSSEKTNPRQSRYLWLSMIFSVIFPILLGFSLTIFFADLQWINYPAHSMVESVGSLSAFTIATLMVLMVNNAHLPQNYIMVACALIAMGILDGSHAVLHVNDSFVWLHSVATLSGGLIFATVWTSDQWLSPQRQKILIISTITISLAISLLSISVPDILPSMVIQSEFSTLATVLNHLGGLGFLIGSSYFIYHNLNKKINDSIGQHNNDDLVFANHCLLFGIAAILFESSVIWDAGWWWWHILRLAAYLIVLVYFFILFKQQQDILSRNEKILSNANKNLELRVYERTKELEKANTAKSDFLSSMSHELRTPMNAILGFSQLLELDENLESDQKKFVKEIIVAGHHLMELINDILDLTKINEGKLNINIEEANISEIIKSSLNLLVPMANQYNINLKNNISRYPDYIVQVDKLRFKQIIINLVSNAIKYNNKDGEVIIDITLIENNWIRISVKDTGPGIPTDQQDKLFKPFERLGFEGAVVEGVGIGLVLSKKLVELINGTIGFNSIPSKGSIFYIELPYTS